MIRELASEKNSDLERALRRILCFMFYVMLCYENTTDQKTLKRKIEIEDCYCVAQFNIYDIYKKL